MSWLKQKVGLELRNCTPHYQNQVLKAGCVGLCHSARRNLSQLGAMVSGNIRLPVDVDDL